MPKDDDETTALKAELSNIAAQIREHQEKARDNAGLGDPGTKPGKCVTKKLLKGHINKVTCCHFSGDSRHAVSGSLDGKLIVWDCWTGNKMQVIPLRSAWVMTAVFAQSGNLVACGGMDNMLTIYDLNNRDSSGVAKMVREVSGYEGFLSSARFLDDETVVTGSGDMKVMQFQVETGKKLVDMAGHNGDVAALSLKPSDKNIFVTGSVDRTARLWDLRIPGCTQTFWGHEADVNSVSFHPSSLTFVTCSEDKTVRLWDIRSDQEVCQYKPPTPNSSFTSVGCSMSGRILLGSSDDSTVHMWDIAGAHCGSLSGHDNRITQIAVAPAGFAIATSSWDQTVRVWGL
ncbi:guanine nucleotide-binding protein subunit beta-2 [Eurytemora carolleeae]|uniref:guanine nucleotide-binding protein subunit beta-2 n=1 Tax=Eurytemora carolleeae TaxID=1294199 RepID=UPI000C7732F0|nr:guanine nucleotide-binding protein subunit beta-2 [Eurytemora carolleeae]|eukprot:XP_023328148.1 guanine nucleotide-binding protein subunit beta-2-like [Eurytemora affinis]